MKMQTKKSWKWVVLWSLWAARLVRQPTLPVHVSNGFVRGSVANDGSHKQYLGIPYATVEHRFQAPGPEPKWKETYEAINENIKCHQKIGETGVVIGQEECLELNIYTPLNTSPDDKLPVMFFIHGGGYYQGSGSKFLYGPEFLAPKGVILVAINYRLNVQGFLCLGIKEAPGNAGMKDQVAALRWVQRNIKSFDGDPDNVTIFGESAGGASVSLHVISPMSKGLFSKAIIQSGSSLSSWTLQYRPVYMASLLAKALGHDKVSEPYDIYNTFMNKSDAELVITRVPRKEGNLIISELLYVPCVERKINGVEPFLTELPYDLFERGDFNKIPLMIGLNGEEGYFFVALENSTVIPKITFEKSLPKDLIIPSTREAKAIAEKLNNIYMGEDKISEETLLKLSKYIGEIMFYYPSFIETELILRSTDKPVYNYLFDYDGWRNLPKLTSGKQFIFAPGATHADELFYLFNLCVLPSKLFENEMIERITSLWTNFVKFGNPTPEKPNEILPMRWTPTQLQNPHLLVLDKNISVRPLWHTDSVIYLRELYSKYRRKEHRDFRD